MPGVAEEETQEARDKGELTYQEAKEFNSEQFLCNAYDNPKTRRVTFEIYGLDTQDMYTLPYEYAAFDNLFRFNAELMNPNRKEGRFHWVIERLQIQTFNGKDDHTLKLGPEPSEEVPQLPTYETTRKIPTGRMDLKERQRLREQMDMLDIRRAENISKKRAATKQRVLEHIRRLQEDDKLRKEAVNKKIEEERATRWEFRKVQERQEREDEAKLEAMRKVRRKAVEVKEERTEEQDEEDYRQLRARWRIRDAEKAKNLVDKKADQTKKLKEREDKSQKLKDGLEKVQTRRQVAWKAREERVRKKESAQIKQILEVNVERVRVEKLQKERNSEYLQTLHVARQPTFKAQLERTEERRLAREAESESLLNYKETRAIPKKVKTKGKNAPKKDEKNTEPKAKAKAKGKSKKGGEEDEESKGVDTEKVLDAVEAKMREQMRKEQHWAEMQQKREDKIGDAQQKRKERENQHNKEIRETFRTGGSEKEQASAERRLILQQKQQEAEQAEERKKLERARLDKVRQQNILIKEQQRFQALCA